MIFPELRIGSKKNVVIEKFPTIINSFSKIAGEISLQTDIRVDGTVYGIVESENNIFIGSEGYVKGIIRAKNLVSFGRIEGTVIVLGTAIFHATSSLFGKLYVRDINVYSGAYLISQITTCNELSPIEEAQISMDEQRTRVLSKALKTEQEILNDFPIDNKINKRIKDTLNVESTNSVEKESYDDKFTKDEQKTIDISGKLSENDEFILNSKNQIVDLEVIEEIVIDNESIISSEDIIVETEIDHSGTSGKSFLFESLLNLSSSEKTEKLKIEIDELNKTSGFHSNKGQSKHEDSNLFDLLGHKLFNIKSKI